MPGNKTYKEIVNAVKTGILKEPFGIKEYKLACPDHGVGTHNAFLYKHKKGNSGGNSELFEQVGVGKFRLLRPFKYGLE